MMDNLSLEKEKLTCLARFHVDMWKKHVHVHLFLGGMRTRILMHTLHVSLNEFVRLLSLQDHMLLLRFLYNSHLHPPHYVYNLPSNSNMHEHEVNK